MRELADLWEASQSAISREHSSIIKYLCESFEEPEPVEPIQIRPGLEDVEVKVYADKGDPPFVKMLNNFLSKEG